MKLQAGIPSSRRGYATLSTLFVLYIVTSFLCGVAMGIDGASPTIPTAGNNITSLHKPQNEGAPIVSLNRDVGTGSMTGPTSHQSRLLFGGTGIRRFMCRFFPRLCIVRARRFTPSCDLNATLLGELGFILNASYHFVDLMYNVTQQIDCASIAASSNVSFNDCVMVIEATSRMLEPSGSCYAALNDIAPPEGDNNRDLVAYSEGSNDMNLLSVGKEDGDRIVQNCGGNDQACNDIVGCQIATAICSYQAGSTVPLATPLLQKYIPGVLARAGTALFDLGYLRTGLFLVARAHPLTATVLAIGAAGAILYCGHKKDECTRLGAAGGLTCNGAACCPDETAYKCGIDCCCCGYGYVPRGSSCACVSGI
jgi:hypothetical protein